MPLDDEAVGDACRRAADALRRIAVLVESVDADALSEEQWLEVNAKMGRLLSTFDAARKDVGTELGLASGKTRILEYMKLHVGEAVHREALNGVAAIDDWARRVRELRVEEGWPISSSSGRTDLSVDEYVLEGLVPDEDIASRWQLAKGIRNMAGSGKDRGLAFLKEIYPDTADGEEMSYVCKIHSWPRRMRELEEEGWAVVTNTDDPSMRPGQYRLESLDRRPQRVREAIKLRNELLERDGFACQMCGRTPNHDHVRLQLHHKQQVAHHGTNDPDNLVTLCSECHAGVHSRSDGTTADEVVHPEQDPYRA